MTPEETTALPQPPATPPAAPAAVEQAPAPPDVPTQPVVPSESAGTQTAAGSPSEQASVPEGASTERAFIIAPDGMLQEADDTRLGPAIDSAGQPLSPEPVPVAVRASGVGVDGSVYRARGDNDVLTNSFCRVIAGEFVGRYGVYTTTASLGADGWPEQVVLRTRDAEDENIVVAYADIRPDVAGRR